MVSKNHKLQQMVQKWKRCSGTEKGLIIMFALLPILLIGGILFGLNYEPCNENRNLAIEFDYGGYGIIKFTGNVVFKKDFEDVSLDMYVSAIGSVYPSKVTGYDLRLTDEKGNEVTDVTVADLFQISLADLLFESLDRFVFYDAYGTAAKACAGHSGADHAVDLPCFFYKGIQLDTGYFIVITQGNMGSIHQFAKQGDVVGL